MTHELKTWPDPFQAVKHGDKRHEIRVADRPFSVGDVLWLREWDPRQEAYTGDSVRREVTYVSAAGTWGLPPNLCVMSIREVAA